MARNDSEFTALNEELERFSKFDKERLIKRPDEWGKISFEDYRLDFERIYEIANYLEILPISELTRNALNTIKTELHHINNLFDQINKFSIETSNPVEQRNQLAGQIQSRSESFYTQTTPWIPFLAYKKGDVSKNIEGLTNSVKQGQQIVEDAKKNCQRKD